jgi:predicted regulator of Ras-like GTPase activity (Roadblock/LC7/MglB family)
LASASPAPPDPAQPPPATIPAPRPEDCIPIPLKAITDLFPPELKHALRKQPSEHVQVNIPRAVIQPQLAGGAVRVSFGQLRAATPEIFFHPEGAPADAMLLLPLEPVLRQMMPSRRDDQRQPAIPVNIPSIFAKAAPANARPGVPASRGGAEPWYSQRRPTYEAPEGGEGRNPKSEPSEARQTAQSPLIPTGQIRKDEAQIPTAQRPRVAPEPVAATVRPTVAPPIPAPAPAAAPVFIPPPPVAAATRIPVPAAAVPAAPRDSVAIPLAAVLPALPRELRSALSGRGRESFAIPMAEFETRIRSGKLRFKWGQLRGWCGAEPSASLAEDTEVELPLATVVPLFLAARQTPDTRKKVEVDSRIPDVFGKSNTPAPAAEAAPAPAPSAAPAAPPLRLEQAPPPPQPAVAAPGVNGVGHGDSKANQEIGGPGGVDANREIGGPGGGDPGKIVRRICALEGVGGAFLATADGLLIVGDVADANDNVLAAFAPTVFSQVAKYSDMARLGPPKAIELHLGCATIHVRKAGKLFLGVLMPPGRSVPLSDIERISAALQPHVS